MAFRRPFNIHRKSLNSIFAENIVGILFGRARNHHDEVKFLRIKPHSILRHFSNGNANVFETSIDRVTWTSNPKKQISQFLIGFRLAIHPASKIHCNLKSVDTVIYR